MTADTSTITSRKGSQALALGARPGGGEHATPMASVGASPAASVVAGQGSVDTPAAARFSVHARAAHVVVVRGALVEHVAAHLKANHGVRVEGRLELRRWHDPEGKPHERVMVVVGGPESSLRVDRTPLPKPGREPRPEPMPDLDPPTPMQSPERADRHRR